MYKRFNGKTTCCGVGLNCLIFMLALTSIAKSEEVFSIDRSSGSPFDHGDILIPDPTVVIKDSALAEGALLDDVEINGISSGRDFGTELLFSVDDLSKGIEGTDVSRERIGGAIGPQDHPADIYRYPLLQPGENFLYRDGDGTANPLAAIDFGLREPFPESADNLDAYDKGPIGTEHYMGPVFFTVGEAAPGVLATDTIFFVRFPGGPVFPYVIGLTMSLSTHDDIDAIFVLDDGNTVFGTDDVVGFSLSRTSPSLESGSPLSLRFAGGAPLSPADIFILTGTGGAFYVPASSHGLLFTDNIDAMDQVPEISDILLGDVNQDGVVNLLDVSPFVQLVSSGEFLAEADINEDGVVNLLDVDPFVALLGAP